MNQNIEYSNDMLSDVSARSGILAGGNWIVDHVKIVDCYPQQDALASILRESSSNGGGPYNVLVDLSQMGATFPLQAVGLIGDDANGQTIFADCARRNIDTAQLHRTRDASTSYTDAMSVESTGRRTFFHRRGANALLDAAHFDLEKTRAKIFYLGYLLLLDKLDASSESHGTVAAQVLERAQNAGLKTAIDVVSEDSDRFSSIVRPALRFVDFAFLNEFEAGRCTSLELRRDGVLDNRVLEMAAQQLMQCGVRDCVVVHFPEGAFALNKAGQSFWQSSVALPTSEIAGATGAGDAFCAGVLFGFHQNYEMPQALKLGVCAAASSLLHPAASLGVQTADRCWELGQEFGFVSL